MSREYTGQTIAFSAQAANGACTPVNMESFRNVEIEVAQSAFSGTIQFVVSNADTAPNFANAASATNPWSYVQVVDQIDGSSIAGGTGIISTTVTSVRNLELNTNAFKWVGAVVSNYSAGSVNVKFKGVANT